MRPFQSFREAFLALVSGLSFIKIAELCYDPLRTFMVGQLSARSKPALGAQTADCAGFYAAPFTELNSSGVATIKRGKLEVHDLAKLKQLASFNPNYLHHLHDDY